jgi:mRNA interferase RelE/StbE
VTSSWHVVLQPQSQRALERVPTNLHWRILELLHRLEDSPRTQGSIKLSGPDDFFRPRVGDWRIVYSVEAATREVVILRIARREKAYRVHR